MLAYRRKKSIGSAYTQVVIKFHSPVRILGAEVIAEETEMFKMARAYVNERPNTEHAMIIANGPLLPSRTAPKIFGQCNIPSKTDLSVVGNVYGATTGTYIELKAVYEHI